jgi:hypothetical protein
MWNLIITLASKTYETFRAMCWSLSRWKLLTFMEHGSLQHPALDLSSVCAVKLISSTLKLSPSSEANNE